MSKSYINPPVSLNALSFPLHGARLIEASAGTGKTFTIAGLYLRLLLGHGDEGSRHHQPLTVDQILVVTFTEAATAELRDRIRARIHQARIAFARGSSDDPIIAPLLEQITDRRFAVNTLLQAERQMDEAAVYTIHGFCQRTLTQNAFESGSRFNNEFITDETRLKAQVVADFWRSHFYPLSMELTSEVRKLWATPSALLADIGRYLTGPEVDLQGTGQAQDLHQLHQDNLKAIQDIKRTWLEATKDILGCISDSGVNKRSYTKKSLPTWIDNVTRWAEQETLDYYYPDVIERFSQAVLIDKTPKGEPPVHSVFSAIEKFLAEPPELKTPLLAIAIGHCRQALSQAKQRKQWLSFDDLLTQLSASLSLDNGDLLAEKIRSQYPVAMIDEFQDTDPLQYQIFSDVYLKHPECGWFMIGDPKQAIYGFRGADIFTYIRARNQVTDHYTLATNWRSSESMVNCVNQLFSQASSPFIYDQDIPFVPVSASPVASNRHWTLEDNPQPALQFWLQDADKPVSKGDYQDTMAIATAQHIMQVLSKAQQGQARLINDQKTSPIKAGDIAVLVRTGAEGQLIKQALADKGIASVYLSNRDSVFSSTVAMDMLRLLQGVWYQEDERLLKAVLASELFSLSADILDSLNNDENLWEQIVAEFTGYRLLWQSRGVLPMLRSVLFTRDIASRLLSQSGGERLLTDFLHLGELLQAQRQDLESESALMRWFGQAIEDAEQGISAAEEHIQRLESEKNLVQIITIHKSKGLEYDLVYLPFVLSYREASEAKYYDEMLQKSTLDLRQSREALAQADKERLAEDLRLIYVAITRAVYGCFVGVAPIRNGRSSKEPTGVHRSAMGYLLQNALEGGVAELQSALTKLQGYHQAIEICQPPVGDSEQYIDNQSSTEELTAQSLSCDIDSDWRITSYSGIVKQGHHHHDNEVLIEASGLDIDSIDEQSDDEVVEPEVNIYHFPKGAQPGTFLHTIFEEVEFTLSSYSEANQSIIAHLLEKEQYPDHWLPVIQDMVDRVLDKPLDGQSMTLRSKGKDQRLVEMEFLLPIEVLDAISLNSVIQKFDELSVRASSLGFKTVRGMLKGFIDLVFEHEGKYYVLDWKSNHLGDDPSHYQQFQLEQAMIDHRYDLQYQIYALALHRFLKSRVANYSYEQHFGGVYYLFLRGIDGVGDTGIFHAKPKKELLNELDNLISGKKIQTAAANEQLGMDF